jgi:hypothetical protein
VVDPPALIYMGRDKYENDEMLKYGYDEQAVWFHVDDLSSAHVYLRMQPDWTLDTIPSAVLVDCAQLTKYNSIEGNKKNNVRIVYTPWSNLKKEPQHDVGQVSFRSTKMCKYLTVERRVNDTVNRLSKTKREEQIDFLEEKNRRIQDEKRQRKLEIDRLRSQDELELAKKRELESGRRYEKVMDPSKMTTNKEAAQRYANPNEYEEAFF